MSTPRFCARRILLAAPVIALLTTTACEQAQPILSRGADSVKFVQVSPATASVLIGRQVQLTAVPEAMTNTPLPGHAISWSSSNAAIATVSDSGLVTAVAVGSATITASSEGRSGTSAIAVDTVSSTTTTHEPPGLILINEQPWDCTACNGWNYRAESGHSDIQADPSAPKSPANVLRVVFPPTMPRDHGPSNQWLGLPSPGRWRELYVAYWIKWGNPWDALEQGAKVSFVWAQGGSYVYAVQVPGMPPYHLGMVVGWTPYGYSYGDRGVWHPNVTTTPIMTGRWYFVEEYFKYATTPGGSDGIIRWWVNGALNGDFKKVTYPADSGFIQFEFPFTRQARPVVQSFVYVDHTRVSGKP